MAIELVSRVRTASWSLYSAKALQREEEWLPASKSRLLKRSETIRKQDFNRRSIGHGSIQQPDQCPRSV